jgi:hypothetical protein
MNGFRMRKAEFYGREPALVQVAVEASGGCTRRDR